LSLLWRDIWSRTLRMLTGIEHDTATAYSESLSTDQRIKTHRYSAMPATYLCKWPNLPVGEKGWFEKITEFLPDLVRASTLH
jgi:hypothetical protein